MIPLTECPWFDSIEIPGTILRYESKVLWRHIAEFKSLNAFGPVVVEEMKFVNRSGVRHAETECNEKCHLTASEHLILKLQAELSLVKVDNKLIE